MQSSRRARKGKTVIQDRAAEKNKKILATRFQNLTQWANLVAALASDKEDKRARAYGKLVDYGCGRAKKSSPPLPPSMMTCPFPVPLPPDIPGFVVPLDFPLRKIFPIHEGIRFPGFWACELNEYPPVDLELFEQYEAEGDAGSFSQEEIFFTKSAFGYARTNGYCVFGFTSTFEIPADDRPVKLLVDSSVNLRFLWTLINAGYVRGFVDFNLYVDGSLYESPFTPVVDIASGIGEIHNQDVYERSLTQEISVNLPASPSPRRAIVHEMVTMIASGDQAFIDCQGTWDKLSVNVTAGCHRSFVP